MYRKNKGRNPLTKPMPTTRWAIPRFEKQVGFSSTSLVCIVGALFAWAACPGVLQAQSPLSVTKNNLVEAPALETKHFEITGALEAVAVPLEGWKVVWPEDGDDASERVSGITVITTNDVIRGARIPVLRLELTRGTFNKLHPVVELDWPFNAETHNLLSFVAKVDVPEGLRPRLYDSPGVYTGWFSPAFSRYFDNFGVAVDDGHFQWAAHGVPTTHFLHHDFPETRGPDGYADFKWDMKYEDHTGNKGFARDRARALRFHYDTRKIPEGEKVVISIAQINLVKGAHIRFPEPERYAAWTNFVAHYTPDTSDSSTELQPPATGRIAKPIRLTENGTPRAEIIVDLSEAIRIENFFKQANMTYETRAARGFEVPVAKLAANDLRAWIQTITGADLPILLAPSQTKNVKIFLGATYAKPYFPKDLSLLASGGSSDGFAVRVKDGNLYIFGARPAGTLNGIYAFIENNTDIIWAIAKDPAGTVFTRTPTLDIVWADAVEKPVFIQRGCQGPTDWQRANKINFPGPAQQGMFSRNGGHYLCPQYYDTCEGLRQFNAMIDGVRPEKWSEYRTLACLEDPTFIKHAFETVPNVQDIRYHGNLAVGANCLFGIDDNYGVCECELCTRPFTNAVGTVISPETDYLAFYGAWFYRYLNTLDDAIQKVWPGFITSTYAYMFASPFPPIAVNKTIVPQLCLYVRKSQNEPIFAPMNAHWWQAYNDWINHTDGLMLYDYYGLGFILKPVADVNKFDLQAQRDIGFLRHYTEGFGDCEYLGAADERWCMARLKWNPDQDVEKLHRRFNRRTYREAAPWIDKFRGTIRENYYKHANRSIEFEETFDVGNVINDLGLAKELRSYLDEALKAVKHPSSKILVEKMSADFDYYMSERGRAFPSKKPVAASKVEKPSVKVDASIQAKDQPEPYFDSTRKRFVFAGFSGIAGEPYSVFTDFVAATLKTSGVKRVQKLIGDTLVGLEADPDTTFQVYASAIPAVAAANEIDFAIALLGKAFADRRVDDSIRERFLVERALTAMIGSAKSLPADQAMALFRQYNSDDFGRAIGWSIAAKNWGGYLAKLANAYCAGGDYAGAAKVFALWAQWDGDMLPISLRLDRESAAVQFFRGKITNAEKNLVRLVGDQERRPGDTAIAARLAAEEESLKGLKGVAEPLVALWRKSLRDAVKDASSTRSRGEALEKLLIEEWDSRTQKQRLADLDTLIFDKFMDNGIRMRATMRLPLAYATATATNWTAAAEHVVRALADGDWSNLSRNTYSRNGRNDLRLMAMCDVAAEMIAVGAKAQAKNLLERAAPILGYYADTTSVSERGTKDADMQFRLDMLDAALAACGARRMPAPKP